MKKELQNQFLFKSYMNSILDKFTVLILPQKNADLSLFAWIDVKRLHNFPIIG